MAWLCAPDSTANLAEFSQAIKRPPGTSNGPYFFSEGHYRAGQYGEALHHLEVTLASSPLPPTAWDLLFLAMIRGRLGHDREARSALEMADEWIAEADKSARASVPVSTGQPHWRSVLEPYMMPSSSAARPKQ